MSTVRQFWIAVVFSAACGGSPPIAPEAPRWEPEDEAKCSVRKSQDQPLIIEWPGNDRAALEASLAKGVVPVAYEGCEMRVLTSCESRLPYAYQGLTRETQNLSIEDASELYTNLPLGAVTLEAELERSGQLEVKMTIAGRYEAESRAIRSDELQGMGCEEATHAIVAVNVGAFELSSGAEAGGGAKVDVFGRGGGVKHRGSQKRLKSGGDPAACAAATRKDEEPPEGCSALLRVEVVPIGEPPAPEPVCPAGSEWDGSLCVRTQVVTRLSCPDGTRLDRGKCIPEVSTQCPSGTRWMSRRGCVAWGGVTPEGGDEEKNKDEASGGNYTWVWILAGGAALGGAAALAVSLRNDDQETTSGSGEPTTVVTPGREGGLDSAPLRWSF